MEKKGKRKRLIAAALNDEPNIAGADRSPIPLPSADEAEVLKQAEKQSANPRKI